MFWWNTTIGLAAYAAGYLSSPPPPTPPPPHIPATTAPAGEHLGFRASSFMARAGSLLTGRRAGGGQPATTTTTLPHLPPAPFRTFCASRQYQAGLAQAGLRNTVGCVRRISPAMASRMYHPSRRWRCYTAGCYSIPGPFGLTVVLTALSGRLPVTSIYTCGRTTTVSEIACSRVWHFLPSYSYSCECSACARYGEDVATACRTAPLRSRYLQHETSSAATPYAWRAVTQHFCSRHALFTFTGTLCACPRTFATFFTQHTRCYRAIWTR